MLESMNLNEESRRPQMEDHIEQLLDEALEESFPASDPPAPAVEAALARAAAAWAHMKRAWKRFENCETFW